MSLGQQAIDILKLALIDTDDPQVLKFCLEIDALKELAEERLTELIENASTIANPDRDTIKLAQLVVMRIAKADGNDKDLYGPLEQLQMRADNE